LVRRKGAVNTFFPSEGAENPDLRETDEEKRQIPCLGATSVVI
jgi:hypothetical protein